MIAVLLDDADQQNDPDDGYDRQIIASCNEREQRADAGRRQCREDCERVDEAFVQHAENDVDGDNRSEDQQELISERGLERQRGAQEARDHAAG